MSAQRRGQIHEAAHAVLAVVAGGTVNRVDHDATTGGGGVDFALPSGSSAWQTAVLAGPVAEVLAGARSAAFTARGSQDLTELRDAGVTDAAAAVLLDRVVATVQSHWATIQAVADRIPVVGSLPGATVHAIVGGATRPAQAPPWPADASTWFASAYDTRTASGAH